MDNVGSELLDRFRDARLVTPECRVVPQSFVKIERQRSSREFEVLRLLAQGRSVRQIAESLGLNAKTVANHQSTIKQKLGADTAIQLLIKANELGMETGS